MSKTVVLVGHCGPDSSYLKATVRSAEPSVKIVSADDEHELSQALAAGADLLLLNRELGYGFGDKGGVEVIASLRPKYPGMPMMLVSNYPEAQALAAQAGALPGFGKRELGTPRVKQLLQDALAKETVRVSDKR